MAFGKRRESADGSPIWFITFADLMCLLMCFFVLLLSFSQMDNQKFKEVAGSMEKAFRQQRVTPIFDLPKGDEMVAREFETVPLAVEFQKKIVEALRQETDEGIFEMERAPNVLTLRVKDAIAFSSGSAEIEDNFKPILNKLGKVLAEMDTAIEVSGHTDNVPLKSGSAFRTNWDLSAARAVQVVEYLVVNHNINPRRLAALGCADGRPLADNTTPEGKAKNRRVEFVIKPMTTGPRFEGDIEVVPTR